MILKIIHFQFFNYLIIATQPETAADKCAYQLCECDRVLGSCLKQYECPSNKPICDAKNVQKDEY